MGVSPTQVSPSWATISISETVEVQLGLNFRRSLLDREEPAGKEFDGEHEVSAGLAITGNDLDFLNR